MYSRKIKYIVCVMLAIFAVSTSSRADENKDKWETEILLQLSELRNEQGKMKNQIDKLTKILLALNTQRRIDKAGLSLSKDKFPELGNKNADVAIVEFSDFECPFCRRHEKNTLPELKKSYIDKGTVKYLFVDYPLSFHEHSVNAAVAGACAQRQGKFWSMHNQIFSNQRKLNSDLYTSLAKKLGLNIPKFKECLKDKSVKSQIQKQVDLGTSIGVRGTPSFLIGKIKNGRLTDIQPLSGAQPFANFKHVLDRTLASK